MAALVFASRSARGEEAEPTTLAEDRPGRRSSYFHVRALASQAGTAPPPSSRAPCSPRSTASSAGFLAWGDQGHARLPHDSGRGGRRRTEGLELRSGTRSAAGRASGIRGPAEAEPFFQAPIWPEHDHRSPRPARGFMGFEPHLRGASTST
jgi:hypothetical protein